MALRCQTHRYAGAAASPCRLSRSPRLAPWDLYLQARAVMRSMCFSGNLVGSRQQAMSGHLPSRRAESRDTSACDLESTKGCAQLVPRRCCHSGLCNKCRGTWLHYDARSSIHCSTSSRRQAMRFAPNRYLLGKLPFASRRRIWFRL